MPQNALDTPTNTVTALHYTAEKMVSVGSIEQKKSCPKMARFAPFSKRRRRKFCQNDHENGEILRHTTSSRPYERRSSAFGHVIFSLAAAQITHLLSCRPPNQCGAGCTPQRCPRERIPVDAGAAGHEVFNDSEVAPKCSVRQC